MNDRPKTIAILGCGWLGLPLGRHLAERGHRVKGATTTPEKLSVLEDAGIEPYRLTLDPDAEGDPRYFFEADVLFFNVPPPKHDDAGAFHVRQVRHAVERARAGGVGLIVFASSTGVYGPLGREVTEDDAGDPRRRSARAVWAAEQWLRDVEAPAVTVLRYAGLYGYDRQPARWFAGRTDVSEGGRPVNMVHRDDAVVVAAEVIERGVGGEVLNVCADEHPTRADFYTTLAAQAGVEAPSFADDEPGAFKVVSNERLKRVLGYNFEHPDPLEPAP